MVTRAYGTANGATIIFSNVGGDKWEATVPFNEDGEWVVEIWAENEAGNVGYMCTVLFAITGHQLQGYVVPRGYTVEAGMRDYTGFPTISQFLCSLTGKQFAISLAAGPEYALDVSLKGGFTIGRAVCSRNVN